MTNVLLLNKNISFTTWPAHENGDYSKQLWDAVGGSFEAVYCDDGIECYGNENGISEHLPQNEAVAFFLDELQEGLGSRLYWGNFVVIFCGPKAKESFRKAKKWLEMYRDFENN